jgi:hypothetical protein
LDAAFIAGSDDAEREGEEEDLIDRGSDEGFEDDEERGVVQFMPGSSNQFVRKRRFLCWNLDGAIFERDNTSDVLPEAPSSIDIEYSDTIRFTNQFLVNSPIRRILGSLSKFGVVLASRSILEYRSYEKWASDAEVTIKFRETDTIDLIACGNGWFAVATESSLLRIYAPSGLELAALSMIGRPTTMIGGENYLAVIFQREVNAKCMILNVTRRRLQMDDALTLKAPIKWIGFEGDTLFAMDPNFQLYKLVPTLGLQWVPVCNARAHFPDGAHDFAPVGVGDGSLWGVFLDDEQRHPLTQAHQKLSDIPLAPQGVDDGYRGYLSNYMQFKSSRKQAERDQAATRADKELVREFAQALRTGNLEFAAELGQRVLSGKTKPLLVRFARENHETELADFLEEFYANQAAANEEEEAPEPEEPARRSPPPPEPREEERAARGASSGDEQDGRDEPAPEPERNAPSSSAEEEPGPEPAHDSENKDEDTGTDLSDEDSVEG